MRSDPPSHRIAVAGLLLLAACSTTKVPGTPMRQTLCRAVPTVEECRAAAESVDDTCLRECIQLQCSGVLVKCSDYIQQKCRDDGKKRRGDIGGFVFRGAQTCRQPKEEIYWCELPMSDKCRAQTMVHELAHSCGWNHGDGHGVPGDSGELRCR